jgi:uncharacterized protein (TIGR02246 family)
MGGDQPSPMTEELNNRFAEAFKTRDFAAVAAMFTDDAVMLPPRRDEVIGRNKIESFWSDAARIKELKFDTDSVTALGDDTAREIGKLLMRIEQRRNRAARQDDDEDEGSVDTNGAQSKKIAGKYVFVWRKIGLEWKLETGIWNVSKREEG